MFVCPDQGEPLTAIENLINKAIPALQIEGFEATTRDREAGLPRALFDDRLARLVAERRWLFAESVDLVGHVGP